jgi:hypothetical protein
MTERRRRPGPLPVIASAVATFVAVLVLLAVQLQAGQDPVLRGGPVASLNPGHQGANVVTRTSGGGQAIQSPSATTTSKAVTTRVSGAPAEVDDD